MKKIRFCIVFLLFAVVALCSEPLLIATPDDADKSPYDNLKYGVPAFHDDLVIVDRAGYAVGFSKKYKVPLWVCYTITADEVQNKVATRSNRFKADSAIPEYTSKPEDYKKTGYDRGHLAPSADMCFTVDAMQESFYMSNMSPQKPYFNRQIWKFLESAVRITAVHEQKVAVVTGSIFYPDKEVEYIKNGVAIPHAFYKVLLDLTPPQKMIGFVLANEPNKKHFTVFATSVAEVERITGLNFFNKLSEEQQKELESNFTVDAWKFE